MSLLDVVRLAPAIANTTTRTLQCLVDYRRHVGDDGYGTDLFDPPVEQPARKMHAICDWTQKQLRTAEGLLAVSRVAVTFLDIAEMVEATAGEGIGDQDSIVLPDGTTGNILDMAGFIDAGTGHPIATDVFLG